jgi:hypothetical protein
MGISNAAKAAKAAQEAKEASRKKRVPLGVPRLRLQVNARSGYKRRWINDKGGRLTQAMEGGYSLVARDGAEFTEEDAANRNESLNDAMSKTVNSDGTKAYLMEIPISWHTADQAEKAKNINETENGLRVGADTHGKPGADGRYVPEEGIKIS